MKRSPLQRRTPLRSNSELKRSPLRRQSDKRRRESKQRRELVADILARRYRCEAGTVIRSRDRSHRCAEFSTDVHEPLTRARGGSFLDEGNTFAICRPCHDWIHGNPKWATELGLLRSQWDH